MVNVVFKQTDSIFGHSLQPNVLTIYIQPNEGFSLSINGKEVGEKFSIAPISFDYETDATATGASPEPYEKLIFDVLNNDSTNYSHWHEVRASWQLIDRIEKLWAENGAPLYEYKSGSMGPTASDDLLADYGQNGFGNLNLRIKVSHLRVVFDSARKQKDKLSFQQFVFLFDFKSSLPKTSHEVF